MKSQPRCHDLPYWRRYGTAAKQNLFAAPARRSSSKEQEHGMSPRLRRLLHCAVNFVANTGHA
jgi:hypothetical protein